MSRSRRRARSQPRPIEGALDRVLDRMGLGEVVERYAVFRDWPERVGREIARVTEPHRVDGDTLIVKVTSSAWAGELSLRQNEILERVNEGRTRTRVRRILFRVDPELKGTESRDE